MSRTFSDKLPLDSLHKPYVPDFSFSNLKNKKEGGLIRPIFYRTIKDVEAFHPYVAFIEQVVQHIVPPQLLNEIKNPKKEESVRAAIAELSHLLPMLICSEAEEAPCTLSFTLLCSANYTHGVGRYVSDILCRWLIPGKFFALLAVHSLNFHFLAHDQIHFFVHQVILEVEDQKELALIKSNLSALIHEIRLNILAVKHARSVMAIKKLTPDEKKTIIQENLSSIIDRPSKEFDHSLFDQMHHFLIKLSAEEKITQIKDRFTPYLEQRPIIFDRDIYNEIQHFVLLFRENFTAARELRHVGRLISFQYLFRKSLQREMTAAPKERHLIVKLMKTHLNITGQPRKVLGVLIGINVLRENELFEERHILSAMRHCIPTIKKIDDSYVSDQRSHDKIRLFYIEVEKEDGSAFKLEEIKQLNRHLPRELKEHFENVLHSVFMPRNDEEIMRNIVILSHQLRYLGDIPQMVISFDTQTEEKLSFTVILLRILHPKSSPLKDLFQRSARELQLEDIEVKEVGHIRKRHIKEANILKVTLNKKAFLRRDYSLDLFKARQAVAFELSTIIGEIRDFNGGIFTKQQEVLAYLKESLPQNSQNSDFILEKYFYSISPPLMRTVLAPSLLKTLYLMLLEALETDFVQQRYFYKTQSGPGYLWVMVGSSDGSFKEEISALVRRLEIPSTHLTSSLIELYGITFLGHIYRCEDTSYCLLFENALTDALTKWDKDKLG